MSELTVLDPIEKLFVNTRGQISDQFRLRKLKMRLGTVGDITAMTAEQFTGLFGSDYMRVVGNRLRKNGLDFRPVEDSALYREGVDDPDFRIRLYSIGVGSLAKLSKISFSIPALSGPTAGVPPSPIFQWGHGSPVWSVEYRPFGAGHVRERVPFSGWFVEYG